VEKTVEENLDMEFLKGETRKDHEKNKEMIFNMFPGGRNTYISLPVT